MLRVWLEGWGCRPRILHLPPLGNTQKKKQKKTEAINKRCKQALVKEFLISNLTNHISYRSQQQLTQTFDIAHKIRVCGSLSIIKFRSRSRWWSGRFKKGIPKGRLANKPSSSPLKWLSETRNYMKVAGEPAPRLRSAQQAHILWDEDIP